MSAPVIVSSSPGAGEADVVLGRPITIVFDQAIDPATVSTQTFSLMGPGQTSIDDAAQNVRRDITASSRTGREYITGTFTFPLATTVVFTPGRALRPNVTYTLLLVGQSSLLATSYIANPAGQAMAQSFQYTFQTGQLNLTAVPPSSPMPPAAPWEKPKLLPNCIQVSPRAVVGNDLTQQIVLSFPSAIDPASFNVNDLIVAGEPLLNDPETPVPPLTANIVVAGNTITITLAWGAMPAPPFIDPPDLDSVGTGPVPNDSDYNADFGGNYFEPLIRVD
jgi:hypothetical protein